MKYNKIVRDGYENKSSYLVSIVFSVLLFLTLCCFGTNIKSTQAYFSGIDGPSLTYEYIITYSSNYPVGVDGNSILPVGSNDEYTIADNTFFNVPEGYQFIGWNTVSDGSGTKYSAGNVITVESNFYLYAIWELVSDSDNSGENFDDEKPSEDNEDNTTGDDDTNNNKGNDENSSGSGSTGGGTGTSGSGGGNGSSGGGTGSSSSSNINGGNSSGSSNNTGNVDKNPVNDTEEDNKEEILPELYEFKFINGESLFAITSCDILNDGTCKLVYPLNNPVRIGYKFKGWSLSNLCINNDIITGDIDVDGNRTYYSCYEIDDDYNQSDNKWIYLVICVWIIAGIFIYFSIRKFKKIEEND